MVRNIKAFLLMLFALVCVVMLFAPLLILQSLRYAVMRKSLNQFWFNVAIGLDQLGGSVIYNEPDWTVSSCTGYYASKGNRLALAFEKVIDAMFGKGHCRNSYRNEIKKNKELIG